MNQRSDYGKGILKNGFALGARKALTNALHDNVCQAARLQRLAFTIHRPQPPSVLPGFASMKGTNDVVMR